MAKVNQTNVELDQHLRDNIGFLEASSKSVDAGFLGEAKRLAATIRVLLHDTQNSQSLLGLLGIKSTMTYINTAIPYNPRNLIGHQGLVGLRIGGPTGGAYMAPLGDGPPTRYNSPNCDFDTWWNETVINDNKGSHFTRRELVLSLANKDGGAHVDPQLDEKYAALKRGSTSGWMVSDGTNEKSLLEIELHSVRQIAYELLRSLGNHGVTTAVA